MSRTIFHSWQADTPTKVGRNFLKDTLDEVCFAIASDTEVADADRDLEVDSDTSGEAGSPPIVDTILKKIDRCAVFVADITFVGSRMDGRPVPNPNVLIEYGWALKQMGHRRIISVMNIAYGKPTRENLPFDLSHLRLPIQYNLPEDATSEDKAKEKKKLIIVFNEAIRASLATIPNSLIETPAEFPQAEEKDGPARFRSKGESLGIDEDRFGEDSKKEISLSNGPAIWLRIMPLKPLEKPLQIYDLKKYTISHIDNLLPLYRFGSGFSWLRGADGFGVFNANPASPTQVGSIAFAFETGEIWSINTIILSNHISSIPFLESEYTKSFRDYIKFLKDFGVNPPYKWIAGITGVKNRYLQYPIPHNHYRTGDGPICLTDTIQTEGTFDGEQDVKEVLLPFFEKIFDKCGLPRPNYLSE